MKLAYPSMITWKSILKNSDKWYSNLSSLVVGKRILALSAGKNFIADHKGLAALKSIA